MLHGCLRAKSAAAGGGKQQRAQSHRVRAAAAGRAAGIAAGVDRAEGARDAR